MPVIGNLVVELKAKANIVVKGLGGEALHGLVFTVLRRTAPDIAIRLHNLEEQEPFSLSPFLDGHELRQGYCHIGNGKTATFRLGIFTDELLSVVIESFFTHMAE
jgi:hypothetical protein